jgi:hypothetical protein
VKVVAITDVSKIIESSISSDFNSESIISNNVNTVANITNHQVQGNHQRQEGHAQNIFDWDQSNIYIYICPEISSYKGHF